MNENNYDNNESHISGWKIFWWFLGIGIIATPIIWLAVEFTKAGNDDKDEADIEDILIDEDTTWDDILGPSDQFSVSPNDKTPSQIYREHVSEVSGVQSLTYNLNSGHNIGDQVVENTLALSSNIQPNQNRHVTFVTDEGTYEQDFTYDELKSISESTYDPTDNINNLTFDQFIEFMDDLTGNDTSILLPWRNSWKTRCW